MSSVAMDRTSSSKSRFAAWSGELSDEAGPPDNFSAYWQMPANYRVMRVSVRFQFACDAYIAFGRVRYPIPFGIALFEQIEPLAVTEYTWIGGVGYECDAEDYFVIAVESDFAPNQCYISWMFEQI